MKQQELSVLSNVIAVARRELADRDDKEIPPRMRRVAKRGGKGLPPPFKVSLIKEIQANRPFRESVLERWGKEEIDDPVGHAFLTDPHNGAQQVGEQAESLAVEGLEAELALAHRTIRSLERQVAESKVRMADVNKRHAAEAMRRDTAIESSRASLNRAVRVLKVRIAELEASQVEHEAVVANLDLEIDELTERLERSVTKARKRRRKAQVKARKPLSPPSDPVEFAGWLDTVERQQRSFRQARDADVEVVSDRPPLRIPGGLLPESSDALVALIEQRPDVIYVDGYNLGAMLVEEIGSAKARTRVVAIADRLASASRARVVVVFDAVGVEGRASMPTPGPAEVRFTHTQIADDEIVELFRSNPQRSMVITSDQELCSRCTAEGCVTVWSEALVEWATR